MAGGQYKNIIQLNKKEYNIPRQSNILQPRL